MRTKLSLLLLTLMVPALRGIAAAADRLHVDLDNGKAQILVAWHDGDPYWRHERELARRRERDRIRRQRERMERERFEHERHFHGDPFIRTGDRVIDNMDRVGVVVMLFADGRAKVQLDGYYATTDYHVRALSKAVRCASVCEGSKVIDRLNRLGTVVAVYYDGRARVQLDGYYGTTVLKSDEMAPAVPCLRGICENGRAMDRLGRVGTVKFVFADGKVKIQLDGYWGMTDSTVNELARMLP